MKLRKLVQGAALVVIMAGVPISAQASLAAKTWPASGKAKQFVKETIVLGMMASPYGTR